MKVRFDSSPPQLNCYGLGRSRETTHQSNRTKLSELSSVCGMESESYGLLGEVTKRKDSDEKY